MQDDPVGVHALARVGGGSDGADLAASARAFIAEGLGRSQR